jgi:hypothetical protein
VKRYFFTLNELRSFVVQAYPGSIGRPAVDEALRELYDNGAPDPNPANEGRRMILPPQWREFVKWVADYAVSH